MPVVAAAFALAAIAWGAIFARRAPLLVGVGVLLVTSYAVGHEFWNAHIGPLPLTLDRIVLAGLVGAFAVQWKLGDLKLRPSTGSDWCLIVLIGILVASTLFSGQPEITDGVTSKWGRLLASFLIPSALYALTRQIPASERGWAGLLAALVTLGVYLACTGMLEVAGAWALVFPRYIANPNLGIHFGRARGPELNSVSLGLYITAATICAWMLLQRVQQRRQQFVLLGVLPLMAFGVLVTYTRSTYIGFAASALVVAAFQIPRHLRWPAVVGGAALGLLFLCASWGQLMNIQREGSAGDSEHSVDQRASFAYVSWHMFCDHPVFGVGFGRFYDQKLPYLSDRRQTVELESIRTLHHHNTILSALTETGIVGLAAFVAVFVAWVRCGWDLAVGATAPAWVRASGVLMLALLANYLCSAVFHDLTLLPSQEMLLFVFAGLTVNLHQAWYGAPARLSIVRVGQTNQLQMQG